MEFFKKKNILLKKHLVRGKLSLLFMITSSEIYKKKSQWNWHEAFIYCLYVRILQIYNFFNSISNFFFNFY